MMTMGMYLEELLQEKVERAAREAADGNMETAQEVKAEAFKILEDLLQEKYKLAVERKFNTMDPYQYMESF